MQFASHFVYVMRTRRLLQSRKIFCIWSHFCLIEFKTISRLKILSCYSESIKLFGANLAFSYNKHIECHYKTTTSDISIPRKLITAVGTQNTLKNKETMGSIFTAFNVAKLCFLVDWTPSRRFCLVKSRTQTLFCPYNRDFMKYYFQYYFVKYSVAVRKISHTETKN